jgi:mono/diheme cytochrome c family protein
MKLTSLILILFALLISACSFSLAADITPPPGSEQLPVPSKQPVEINGPLYPLVPPNPGNGQAIYTEKCVPCHGQSGLGDGPQAEQLPNPVAPIGSSEFARQSTPAHWYSQVTQGNLEKFMPPFNSLSDRQRWDVVAYSFTLSAPPVVVEQGAELYQANCAQCHGLRGQGDGPETASLAKPPADLSDQSFMAEKSEADFFQVMTEGIPPDMPAFGESLTEQQLWSLAAYVRRLTFTPSEIGPIAIETSSSPEATAEEGTQAMEAPVPTTAEGTQELGKVTGQVINVSSGEIPVDMTLTLHGFDHMQSVISQTTTLEAEGLFTFEEVEKSPELAYVVTLDYDQATYGSDIGIFEEGVSELYLPVEIYETTTDTSILAVDRVHIFFEFIDEETVRVIELYIVSNPTNETLVAPEEGGTTVNFTVPDGATNLEFQDGVLGERYISTSNGFGDTIAVRPGTGAYEILYAYEMPYERKLDLVHPMHYPVDAVVIMIPEDGVRVKGEMLRDDGTRDVQGVPYHLYSGGGLQAGDNLQLTLSGRPTASSPSIIGTSSTGLIIGLMVFGVALIVGGVWLFSRTRREEGIDEVEEERTPESELDLATEDVDTLVDAIIALDDLYREGQLPEEAYLRRRAELKARLAELMEN